VTHDQEEALTLSDRIAIIDRGKLVQVGAPQSVYERPGTLFAAQFLGDANVLSGVRSGTDIVLADGSRIAAPGHAATVVVRPEKIEVATGNEELPSPLRNRMRGVVLQAIYSGASVTYRIRADALGETPLLAFVQNRRGEVLEPGVAVIAAWAPEHSIPVAP
jgi:putative spermidine/putrescine transport system ATP-binding protein/spermidine/putrescine transport system ATP-binding protein